MRKTTPLVTALLALAACGASSALRAEEPNISPFRPPSVPVVTFNPFLSIWSDADKLTGDSTRHWTHKAHPILSMVRIDGTAYRLMGMEPANVPAMNQTSTKVLPTRTICEFEGAGVKLTLIFMTPALPEDLSAFSLPLSYVTWTVAATDGKSHDVQTYLSASGLLAVDRDREAVTSSMEKAGDLVAVKVGTTEQKTLGHQGDDARINWGWAYVATTAPNADGAASTYMSASDKFASTGKLAGTAPGTAAKQTSESAVAVSIPLGAVAATPVSAHAIVAYDEDYAIKFFGKNLRPYWNKDNKGPMAMLQMAEKNYDALVKRCEIFDAEVWADATKVGGEKYAQMCALAYRQSSAGTGLAADPNGQPMFFTKENTSNGDIATVDVIFPMDPVWVLFSPTLAKATIAPVFAYAASNRWTFPCSPHDLGTYPIARGTDDGGEAMPVEESGNMLILADAIAQRDGNVKWLEPYWPQIASWADYLQQFGLDPENQLCTDDFMGHLAHNANLSVKAIVALAAYGDLCRIKGDTATAEKYMKLARDDAAHWQKVAVEGDHSVLAFDKPHTWSQKYNLAWDRILGLNVFPPEVAAREVAFYKAHLRKYGLSLDSRPDNPDRRGRIEGTTKSDWTIWSASLATNKADFETIISPLFEYLNTTPNRVPFSDGYHVTQLKGGDFFHARPVIGGVFIQLLTDPEIWKKWASRDKETVGLYAAIANKPTVTDVVPTAAKEHAIWQYTFARPAGEWFAPKADVGNWKSGPGGFGTPGTPSAHLGTTWNTADIWVRRTIKLPDGIDPTTLKLHLCHDEDVEVYINGEKALTESGFVGSYDVYDLPASVMGKLKAGQEILLAMHCHQTTGGQYLDAGFATVVLPK